MMAKLSSLWALFRPTSVWPATSILRRLDTANYAAPVGPRSRDSRLTGFLCQLAGVPARGPFRSIGVAAVSAGPLARCRANDDRHVPIASGAEHEQIHDVAHRVILHDSIEGLRCSHGYA